MNEINTTPLIDVMLVLLVMLIITIPVQLDAVSLALPVGRPPDAAIEPDKVQVDIDAAGTLYWQGLPVTVPELQARMAAAAARQPQPDVHLRPDARSSYAVFAHVLAESRRLGLAHVAVIGSEQFAP